MAVYKKTYRPYEGPLTASWSRFLVIRRYGFEDLRRSRFLSVFYLATFVFPLICGLIVWVEHNASALKLLNIEQASRMIAVDAGFYMTLLGWQSMLALFLAAFIGPGQISPDLANNALSLYLARPFSRTEYVLGKLSVLLTLLSLMTWVPGLLLFGLQSYLEGRDWAANHLRIVTGTFFGAWIWISVIALLALALSAWVKWKPAAGALLFGIFFVASGFGGAINAVQDTKWGYLLNISNLVGSVWVQLFEGDDPTNNGALFFRVAPGSVIPVWCCWAVLLLLCGACIYMLSRKIRGAEVVR